MDRNHNMAPVGRNRYHPPRGHNGHSHGIHETTSHSPTPLTAGDLGRIAGLYLAMLRARWWQAALIGLIVGGAIVAFFYYTPVEHSARTTVVAHLTPDEVLQSPASASRVEVQIEAQMRTYAMLLNSKMFHQLVASRISDAEAGPLLRPYPAKSPDDDVHGRVSALISRSVKTNRELGRYAFSIRVHHRDAEMALFLARRFSDVFIDHVQEERLSNTTASIARMEEQAETLYADMTRLDEERREYRRRHNLITVEESQGLLTERLQRYNAALSDVRVEAVRLTAKIEQARRDLQHSALPFNNPDLSGYGDISKLHGDYQQLKSQYGVLSAHYGPRHPVMVDLNQNITEHENSIRERFQAALLDLESRLETAHGTEDDLQKALNDTFNQSLQIDHLAERFNALGREVTARNAALTALLNQLAITRVQGEATPQVMRVTDHPHLIQPSVSRARVTALLAGLMGFAGFLAAPLGLQAFSQRVSSTSDLEEVLDFEVAGVVPWLGKVRPKHRGGIVRKGAHAAYTESFLGLAGELDMTATGDRTSVLITSTLPGEGKTLIAANLADAFNHLGRSVVLVDCDLRRPSLNRIHSVKGDKGLLSWLGSGGRIYDDLPLCDHPELGLIQLPHGTWMIPAGGSNPDPSRHFADTCLSRLLHRLEEEFDVVVVDTSPAGYFQDAQRIARVIHQTLYVVRPGRVPIKQARRALSGLSRDGSAPVRLICNGLTSWSAHPRYAYSVLRPYYARYYASQSA